MSSYDKQYCELSPAVHDLVSALNAGHDELSSLNGKFGIGRLRVERGDVFGSPHAYAVELRNVMQDCVDTIAPLKMDTDLLSALSKQMSLVARLRLLSKEEADVVTACEAINFLASTKNRISYT